MATIYHPGQSSLHDCPSLSVLGGYEVPSHTVVHLALQPTIELDEDHVARARFADALCPRGRVFEGTVDPDPDVDHLLIQPPNAVLDLPGIYTVEVGMFSSAGATRPYYSQQALLSVEPSLWGVSPGETLAGVRGPITVGRIRLQLREHDNNRGLVEGYEFSTAEILDCLRRPVEYWNETPPTSFRFDLKTFPYHYQWVNATISRLLAISSGWYLRHSTNLTTSGGTKIDDRSKHGEYQQLSDRYWAEYVEFVRQNKMAMVRGSGARQVGGAWKGHRYR